MLLYKQDDLGCYLSAEAIANWHTKKTELTEAGSPPQSDKYYS